MPIDPATHRLWYDYYFTPLYMGGEEDRPPRYTIKVTADGYQQCVSISAFLHGVRKKDMGHDVATHRKYDPKNKILWIGKEESDFRMQQHLNDKSAVRIETMDVPDKDRAVQDVRNYHPDPDKYFDNVFAFYEFIGYDYKKKKFTI